MLHRGIKFAYAVLMLASVALSFVIVRSVDEVAPRGPSHIIIVEKSDDGASALHVAAAVEDLARLREVNIGRLYLDPLDIGVRRVHLTVGNQRAESTRWLADGYPSFSRENRLEVRPFAEIASVEPDGVYYFYGSQSAAYALVQQFHKLGYRAEIKPASFLVSVLQKLGNGTVLHCFLVMGLVGVVAVASAVALNAKSYGIQRLQGGSFGTILWRDLSQLTTFCAAAAIAVSTMTVLALYLYNGLSQLGIYTSVALSFAGVYAFAALLTHVATLALLHRGAILGAVKGDVTATWAIVGSYVLRGWGILLMLSIGTSAIASGNALEKQRDVYQVWTSFGSAYFMRIDGSIEYLKNGKEIDNRIGQWIRDADRRSEVSVASRQELPGIQHDVLVVNNRYLTKHMVYDASGARVLAEDTSAVRVLVPQRHSAESAAISAGVKDWAKSISRGARPVPEVQLGQLRNDQSPLSYTRLPGAERLALSDSVLVVVTGDTNVISNGEYVSLASRGELVVENPAKAMKSLADAGVGGYILGMSPFAQDAAVHYRDAKRDFTLQVVNLVAALAVLLVTALAVSIVYCRRNLQRLFVQHIHGWTFWRAHSRILAVEVALGLALIAWVWHGTAAVISSHDAPGAPPLRPGDLILGGWEPAVAGGMALTSLTLIALTLKLTNLRFVRAHSANLP